MLKIFVLLVLLQISGILILNFVNLAHPIHILILKLSNAWLVLLDLNSTLFL